MSAEVPPTPLDRRESWKISPSVPVLCHTGVVTDTYGNDSAASVITARESGHLSGQEASTPFPLSDAWPFGEKQRLCLTEGKTVRVRTVALMYSRLPTLVPRTTNRSMAWTRATSTRRLIWIFDPRDLGPFSTVSRREFEWGPYTVWGTLSNFTGGSPTRVRTENKENICLLVSLWRGK